MTENATLDAFVHFSYAPFVFLWREKEEGRRGERRRKKEGEGKREKKRKKKEGRKEKKKEKRRKEVEKEKEGGREVREGEREKEEGRIEEWVSYVFQRLFPRQFHVWNMWISGTFELVLGVDKWTLK